MNIGVTIGMGKTQYQINQAYVSYVEEAGFEPILISPLNDVTAMANLCDGLLLPGGIDIDPIYYGEDNDRCYGTNLPKDDFERSVFAAFIEAQKPVFGICRGFQLMAREVMSVKDHPSLQYMQDVGTHSQPNIDIPRDQASHFVVANTGKLHNDGQVKPSRLPVNSMHHQALIARIDKGNKLVGPVEILAISTRGLQSKDVKTGHVIVEAANFNAWPGVKVRGVQWHPEELLDVALLHSFFGQVAQENGA